MARMGFFVLSDFADGGHFHLTGSLLVLAKEICSITFFGATTGTTEAGEAAGGALVSVVVGTIQL